MKDESKQPQPISIAFEDAWREESVALFSTSLGIKLVDLAKQYLYETFDEIESGNVIAGFVMANFIAWLGRNNLVDDSTIEIYLGIDKDDINSMGWGHRVIRVLDGVVSKEYEGYK